MATERFEYPTHADNGTGLNLQDAMNDPLGAAEDCVTDHPLASVGTALAGGFVAGLLIAGMVSDMRRPRRRTLGQRAHDRFDTATDRAGDLLADVGHTVREAIYDAMPNDLVSRFR